MGYYILLALFLLFVVIISERLNPKSKLYLFVISGFVLFLFAGLRGSYIDKDYDVYEFFLKSIPSFEFFFSNFSVEDYYHEPTFILIGIISKAITAENSIIFFIFFYSILGVLFKLYAIWKLSDFAYYSLLLYFCNFYFLHEMTQIRVGVASGIVLISLPYILSRDKFKYFGLIILASAFHYSAVLFAPFYFLNTKKINIYFYMSLIFGSIFLYTLKIDPFSLLLMTNIDVLKERILLYQEIQTWQKQQLNPLNIPLIVNLLLVLFFLLKADLLGSKSKYFYLLLKINSFALASFYLLASIPVFSLRIYDLLGVVNIILIPHILYIIKPKTLVQSILILYSLSLLYNILFANGIMQPYKLIF